MRRVNRLRVLTSRVAVNAGIYGGQLKELGANVLGGEEGFAEDVVDAGFPVGVVFFEATGQGSVQGDGDVFYHGGLLARGAGAAMR